MCVPSRRNSMEEERTRPLLQPKPKHFDRPASGSVGTTSDLVYAGREVDDIDDMLGLSSEPKSKGKKRKAVGEAAKHVKKINTGAEEEEDDEDEDEIELDDDDDDDLLVDDEDDEEDEEAEIGDDEDARKFIHTGPLKYDRFVAACTRKMTPVVLRHLQGLVEPLARL